jgi:serine/threonine protein kinase
MAPEINVGTPYDAQKADVWSLAILYCCMILRRLPWKAAALSDEAFKLFTTMKGRNMHAERGMGRRSTEPLPLQALNAAAVVPSDLVAANKDTVSKTNVNPDGAAETEDTECVMEPCWLLRQLPSESRALVRKMLLLSSKNRPTLEQICDHPWIRQSLPCPQEDSEAIHYGPHHEHVLRLGAFTTKKV